MLDVRRFGEDRKSGRKFFPDLVLDFVRAVRAVDQHDSAWVVRSDYTISFPNPLIKFGRLLFHTISFAARALHSRLRSRGIDVEHECDIREAIAHRERVQALNHLAIQFACRSLIHCGGIEEPVGDHTRAAFERWPDYLADELAAAGRKKQQLRLGGHRGVVRSKLQKLANRFADRRAAWFAGQDTRNTTSLKVHG